IPESPISPRLQHRPAPLFLAIALGLDLSLERLFPRRRKTLLQARRSSRRHAPPVPMLGWILIGVFHLFVYARVLLHARLSGLGSSHRRGDMPNEPDSSSYRSGITVGDLNTRRFGNWIHSGQNLVASGPWRHFPGSRTAPGVVYSVS